MCDSSWWGFRKIAFIISFFSPVSILFSMTHHDLGITDVGGEAQSGSVSNNHAATASDSDHVWADTGQFDSHKFLRRIENQNSTFYSL